MACTSFQITKRGLNKLLKNNEVVLQKRYVLGGTEIGDETNLEYWEKRILKEKYLVTILDITPITYLKHQTDVKVKLI